MPTGNSLHYNDIRSRHYQICIVLTRHPLRYRICTMLMVQGTGNPSPTVSSYYIPCRRGRVSRPGQAFPDSYHVGCAYRRVKDAARYGSDSRTFLQIVDMPLARLDIFASQNRYIANAIRYDINPTRPAGHIECNAHIEHKAHIERPDRDLYR